VLRRPAEYAASGGWIDILFVSPLLRLVFLTWGHFDISQHATLVAVIVLMRWWQLMFHLRAFSFAGSELMPILNSFYSITGMALIGLIVFCMFLFAFMSLETSAAEPDLSKVFMGTFRMLFIGDGTGIDTVDLHRC